jgi:hypothetical protein
LRYMDEFHMPNAVLLAEPGSEVPLAPDPRSPERASLGPIARRLLLLESRAAASEASLRLTSVVAQLASASLDSATSAPVTHATAPTVDGILLGPSTTTTVIESRIGTATTEDACCGNDGGSTSTGPTTGPGGTPEGGSRRLLGSLTFQGLSGEFVSAGHSVSLPAGTLVSVTEPNPRSLELTFETHDGWELDLSAAQDSQLAPGTYKGAARYPFEEGNEPGLSLSGAGRGCNKVSGEFTVTKLRRDRENHLLELAARFTQRCDDGRQPVKGMVTIGEQ